LYFSKNTNADALSCFLIEEMGCDAELNTLDIIRKDHRIIAEKIQLLEKALLKILKERASNIEFTNSVEEFLKFFRIGIIQHFKVEETALFPVLQNAFKDKKPLIEELLSEHKKIIDEYLSFYTVRENRNNRREKLAKLLRELSNHAKKEESLLPSLVKMLDDEMLKKIDKVARKLGYPV